jgi:NADH-quinone oxidoreductase subunit F
MDLRLPTAPPTEAEERAVDAVLGPAPEGPAGTTRPAPEGRVAYGGHSARAQRHLLLPALRALQDAAGWISPGGLGYVCERLTVAPAEAYGVASFYALFDVEDRGPVTVHVCDDVACGEAGEDMIDELTARPDLRVVRSPCLGACDRAPACVVQRAGAGLTAASPATPSLEPTAPHVEIHQVREHLRVLRRVDHVDPGSLDDYVAEGGGDALTRAAALGPEGVLEELDRSGLRGRGGAAFPIGRKWRAVRAEPGPRHIVANGDESEPGTFKDRLLMEGDPFAVVEALAIGALVVGADRGWIYVRGEYPDAQGRLEHAVEAATAAGWLDHVRIEVRAGAGAYVCGEETALFRSIEGHRGEPSQKPPYPNQVGLFGRPTAVNNIETLAAVLDVLTTGGAEYAALGTPGSTGTKLFSISGAIADPGVYEVPMGTSLGDLIGLAGGISGSGTIGAVLLGGAAGSFAGPDDLDVPLSFEGAADRGLTLGSGGVVVFDDTTDFGPVVRRIARFFAEESCGQCVPCRIGTVRQHEALVRLGSGAPMGSVEDERMRLADLDAVMSDASICGLGRTAAVAVRSALRLGLRGVVA